MTEDQLNTIRDRALNECAREMMRDGVDMTHAEADELGVLSLDWLSDRLGLRVVETDAGVECVPTGTIRIPAKRYEDDDDSLAAASAEYVDDHPEAAGYDLNPRWDGGDEGERDYILLDVPS